MLKLHSYYRSSASYRCRIALNLKGLPYDLEFVHLVKDGGQQNAPNYRSLNPQGLLPTLEHDGRVLTQSLAIIEYLEETWPEPHLLPPDAETRAHVRAFALAIASDTGPVNNLRVLRYLKRTRRQSMPGIGTGRTAGSRLARRCCRRLDTPSVSAKSRRSPTSCSCRSSTMRACSGRTSRTCRASSASMRRVALCRPSPRPRPKPSPTRCEWGLPRQRKCHSFRLS